jgi:hypothetical protein
MRTKKISPNQIEFYADLETVSDGIMPPVGDSSGNLLPAIKIKPAEKHKRQANRKSKTAKANQKK